MKSSNSEYHIDSAYLNLTTACNLFCKHCFIDAGTPRRNELHTQELSCVLSEIASIGAKKVVLTGGEPLVRSDFREVVDFAFGYVPRGIGTLSLVTNATLVDDGLAKFIARRFKKINVSIDGIEQANDAIRGTGSFRKTVDGLRHLVASGARPTAFITLTKSNLSTVDQLIAFLANDLGIRNFRFRRLWLFGRALGISGLQASTDEIAARFRSMGINQVRGLSLSDSFGANNHGYGHHSGPLGYNLNVHPDGNVYPCHLLCFPEFIAGNVRRESIRGIFDSSSLFHALRAWGIGCCQQSRAPRLELKAVMESMNVQ